MSNVLRLSSCLVIAAALAACSKPEPSVADAPAAPAAAATAATPEPASAPTASASTELSMDKVRKYVEAIKNLAAAEKADPSIGDSAQNISEEDTDQFAARLEANAPMRAAIAAAGLTTREYAHIGETLLSAMMAEGAVRAGQLKAVPDGIDPAAVEFVKQHGAEIQALMTGANGG